MIGEGVGEGVKNDVSEGCGVSVAPILSEKLRSGVGEVLLLRVAKPSAVAVAKAAEALPKLLGVLVSLCA
jgi:hypothetical protein